MRLYLTLMSLVSVPTVASLFPWTWVFWTSTETSCPPSYLIQAIVVSTPAGWIWFKGRCHLVPHVWREHHFVIENIEWWRAVSYDKVWIDCPQGYFLHGVTFSKQGEESSIEDINYARCVRPTTHPLLYPKCYSTNVNKYRPGADACADSFFITGFYIEKSYVHRINSIKSSVKKIKCCKMMNGAEPITSKSVAEDRIMEWTYPSLAVLAEKLGFLSTRGCHGLNTDEDFVRMGYSYRALGSQRCHLEHPLIIEYDFYPFPSPKTSLLESEMWTSDLGNTTVDSGTLYNNHSQSANQIISREIYVSRTVANTKLSEFTFTKEAEIKVELKSVNETSGLSVSYNFKYEDSETNEDEEQNTHGHKFTVNVAFAVNPFTALDYEIIVGRSRRTIPYNVYVEVPFAVTLKGQLKSGLYNDSNFHCSYIEKGAYKFAHQFGNESMPFWQVLKKESDMKVYTVWMWDDMISRYPLSKQVLDSLTDAKKYRFLLEGEFKDVRGTHAAAIVKGQRPINSTSSTSDVGGN